VSSQTIFRLGIAGRNRGVELTSNDNLPINAPIPLLIQHGSRAQESLYRQAIFRSFTLNLAHPTRIGRELTPCGFRLLCLASVATAPTRFRYVLDCWVPDPGVDRPSNAGHGGWRIGRHRAVSTCSLSLTRLALFWPRAMLNWVLLVPAGNIGESLSVTLLPTDRLSSTPTPYVCLLYFDLCELADAHLDAPT
jgi:hypothetical protein